MRRSPGTTDTRGAYAEALKAGSTAFANARVKVAAALALKADAELNELELLLQKLQAKAQ